MKKLKLDLDDLQVESFATEPQAEEGGVRGYYGTAPSKDCQWTETTCLQRICDCSAFHTDCDYTCPNYWNAAHHGCN